MISLFFFQIDFAREILHSIVEYSIRCTIHAITQSQGFKNRIQGNAGFFSSRRAETRRHARNCRESRVHPRSVTSVPLLEHSSCASRRPRINMVHLTLVKLFLFVFSLNAQINTSGAVISLETQNKL